MAVEEMNHTSAAHIRIRHSDPIWWSALPMRTGNICFLGSVYIYIYILQFMYLWGRPYVCVCVCVARYLIFHTHVSNTLKTKQFWTFAFSTFGYRLDTKLQSDRFDFCILRCIYLNTTILFSCLFHFNLVLDFCFFTMSSAQRHLCRSLIVHNLYLLLLLFVSSLLCVLCYLFQMLWWSSNTLLRF